MTMRKFNALPPRERLHELFSYEPNTGCLRWRISRGKASAGSFAGSRTDDGYLRIGINGIYFYAHRIIWSIMTGSDPGDLVDHRDTDKSNDAWENLRLATDAQNNQNRGSDKRNASGVKGITWNSFYGKWQAQIWANKKKVDFGRFDTVEDAAKAIAGKREELHGEFARAS